MKNIILILISFMASISFADPECAALSTAVGKYEFVRKTCNSKFDKYLVVEAKGRTAFTVGRYSVDTVIGSLSMSCSKYKSRLPETPGATYFNICYTPAFNNCIRSDVSFEFYGNRARHSDGSGCIGEYRKL